MNPEGFSLHRTQPTHMQDAPQIPTVRDQRIYLALPAYGGLIHSEFSLAVLQTTQQPNLIAQVEYLNGDSLVSRARNKLAKMFLEGRESVDNEGNRVRVLYDWLMFIDTDLVFPPDAVRRLFNYAVAHGPGVYCGAYPLKTLKPKVVFNPMPGAQIDSDGVLEVRESGTGFMLIHRSVFEQMREKFADEITYEADQGNISKSREIEWDFFSVGVRMDPILKYKRFLSEDWYFCQRWREIGGKVMLMTTIQCAHIGTFKYPAAPQDIYDAAEVYRMAEKQAAEMKAQMEAKRAEAAA